MVTRPVLYYIHVSAAALLEITRHAGRMDVRSVGVEEELLLVETEARAWQEDAAPLRLRPELIRLASWRASRSGLDGPLVNR